MTKELLAILQQGDLAGLDMEKAREAVENARNALEFAKDKFEMARQAFDDVAAAADEAGLPKAKFKKLIEERTAVLVASGFVTSTTTPSAPKAPRARKAKAPAADVFEDTLEGSIDVTESEPEAAFVN